MLSICMIARDEEDVLERAIKSFSSLDCELCIVDTGSKDDTYKIIKNYADRFTQDTSCNASNDKIADFSMARNISLRLATKPWILVLDADEIISQDSLNCIRYYTQQTKFSAVSVKITTNNSHCFAVRLFTNHPQHKFTNIVHEVIQKPLYKIKDERINIINIPNKFGKESSIDRDIRLCQDGIKMKKNPPRYLLYLASAYKISRRYEKAIECFRNLLDVADYAAMGRHHVYKEMSECFLSLQVWQEARHYAELALKNYSKLAQTYCIYADSCVGLNEIELASQYYQKACSMEYSPTDYAFFIDGNFTMEYPRKQLHLCQKLLTGVNIHEKDYR